MNKHATLYAPKLQNGSTSCLTIILLLLNSVHIFFINSWAEPDLDFNATVTSLLLCSSYTWYKSCKDVLICSVDVEHTVLKKLLPGNRHLHLFLLKKENTKLTMTSWLILIIYVESKKTHLSLKWTVEMRTLSCPSDFMFVSLLERQHVKYL